MIAGRHLSLVTERDESLGAFEAFEGAFAADADLFRDRVVGFQSGSWRVDVHWHGSAEIWGVFVCQPRDHQSGKPLHQFWNSFGVADPNQHSSLSITVEINPPHEGENPRTAGVFLRDELGRLYVGHTGRLGVAGPASAPGRSANLPRISRGKRSRRQKAASAALWSSVCSRNQRCCSTNLPATSTGWPSSRLASRPGLRPPWLTIVKEHGPMRRRRRVVS